MLYFVFYIFNANYICSASIKNQTKEELFRAYQEVYPWLMARGFKPLLHKLGNETSCNVEDFVTTKQTCIQYTPPDIHRTNPVEHAIRTWKNHFLAGIAGLPKSFPIANWCHLTTQTNTTLNMLHHVDKIQPSPPTNPRLLLLRCHTHGTSWHRSPHPHETKFPLHMGILCIQCVVPLTCRTPLSMHQSDHG